MSEPNTTDALVNWLPEGMRDGAKTFLDRIGGFLNTHTGKAVETGALTSAILALTGDNATGDLIGGTTAGILKNLGVPSWLAGLIGFGTGKIGQDHPIMGTLSALMPIMAVGMLVMAAGVVQNLFGGFGFGNKPAGSDHGEKPAGA